MLVLNLYSEARMVTLVFRYLFKIIKGLKVIMVKLELIVCFI